MEQVKTLPHENNHIVVSWMNRPLGTYCDMETGVHGIETSVVADATVNAPYVSIRTVKVVPDALNNTQPLETVMSIIVTHEIAHTLGLTEQYDVEGHCLNEEGEKVYFCCMERISYSEDVQRFKNRVSQGLESVFCPDCFDQIYAERYNFYLNNKY